MGGKVRIKTVHHGLHAVLIVAQSLGVAHALPE